MRLVLFLVAAIVFAMVILLSGFASPGEAFVGILATFVATYLIERLIVVVVLVAFPEGRANEHQRLAWATAGVIAIALIAIPHFATARQLAPERHEFTQVAKDPTQCTVGLAGSNAPVNCGGALDKIIQFRDDLVAQRGCVTFGSWEDTNGTTPFVALYLCAPWRAWTVRRAQPPREATNVASFFYFIRRLPSRK